MPKGAFPGFIWDPHMQSYRRVSALGWVGAAVGRDEIIAVLKALADRSTKLLGDLVMALVEGAILEQDAYLAGRLLLKDLYNAASALAVGGWSQMTPAQWGRNGQILRGEYAYWRDFMHEVATDNLSEAQIRARAALYIGKAYSRFWAEDRLLKLGDDTGQYHWEEWHTQEDERVCEDCPHYAWLGRMPIGTFATVPGAGATRCGGNCRCWITYS